MKEESGLQEMVSEINPLRYGILSVTTPSEHPYFSDEGGISFFTTKEVYQWVSFISHWIEQNNSMELIYSRIDRIFDTIQQWMPRFREGHVPPASFVLFLVGEGREDLYSEYSPNVNEKDPDDAAAEDRSLSNSYQQYLLDTEAYMSLVANINEALQKNIKFLEENGYIADPFLEILGFGSGIPFAVIGLIPVSFTKKTSEGDMIYKKISALLWEYEYAKDQKGKEMYELHFKMGKAISYLKRSLDKLISDDVIQQKSD